MPSKQTYAVLVILLVTFGCSLKSTASGCCEGHFSCEQRTVNATEGRCILPNPQCRHSETLNMLQREFAVVGQLSRICRCLRSAQMESLLMIKHAIMLPHHKAVPTATSDADVCYKKVSSYANRAASKNEITATKATSAAHTVSENPVLACSNNYA